MSDFNVDYLSDMKQKAESEKWVTHSCPTLCDPMAYTVHGILQAAMQETQLLSLGWEDPLEKEKATHSSILAWRIPWNV